MKDEPIDDFWLKSIEDWIADQKKEKNKIKFELKIDVDLFDKMRGRDINKYIVELIKNDLI